MMPSPMRAEYHRWASDSSASTTASAGDHQGEPDDGARPRRRRPAVIALMTWPASTGVATPMPAASTTVIRKTVMSRR